MPSRLKTIKQSSTWRNIKFKDNFKWNVFTRIEVVKKIQRWELKNYHIRNINWVKTPVSNPDSTKNNNLN